MEQREVKQAIGPATNGTGWLQSNDLAGHPDGYVNYNPYTGLPVNPMVADKLYADLITKNLDSQIAFGRKQQEHEWKKELEAVKQEGERKIYEMRVELEEKKQEMALKRDEALYRRKINREMAQISIFENSEGYLCQEIIFPEGEIEYSRPIVNQPNLQMMCLYSVEGDDVVAIVGINNFAEKVILREKNFDAIGLGKMLQTKGVVIGVCREKKKQVLELIFAYLVERAEKRKIPNSLGWYQTEQGWAFAERISQTMLGAMKGEFEYE